MERWRVPLLLVSAFAAVAMVLAWLLDPPAAPPAANSAVATSAATATAVGAPSIAHVPATASTSTSATVAPAPSQSEALIAVPFEPPKPGAQGAGDDFAESGLPRPLWDLWTGLQARAPNEKHVASAESLLKRPLTDAEKKSLTESFAKNDERAQLAIGKFRQKLWTEEQTATQLRDAASVYRKRVTELLKLSDQEFEQIFGK